MNDQTFLFKIKRETGVDLPLGPREFTAQNRFFKDRAERLHSQWRAEKSELKRTAGEALLTDTEALSLHDLDDLSSLSGASTDTFEVVTDRPPTKKGRSSFSREFSPLSRSQTVHQSPYPSPDFSQNTANRGQSSRALSRSTSVASHSRAPSSGFGSYYDSGRNSQ